MPEWFEFKEKPQIGQCFKGSLKQEEQLLFGGDEYLYKTEDSKWKWLV